MVADRGETNRHQASRSEPGIWDALPARFLLFSLAITSDDAKLSFWDSCFGLLERLSNALRIHSASSSPEDSLQALVISPLNTLMTCY